MISGCCARQYRTSLIDKLTAAKDWSQMCENCCISVLYILLCFDIYISNALIHGRYMFVNIDHQRKAMLAKLSFAENNTEFLPVHGQQKPLWQLHRQYNTICIGSRSPANE